METNDKIAQLEQEIKVKQRELEELKGKIEWPKIGDSYWCVDIDLDVPLSYYLEDRIDLARQTVNNMYRTKEEAENRLKWILLDAEIRKYLKIEGGSYALAVRELYKIFKFGKSTFGASEYFDLFIENIGVNEIDWWLENM